MQTEEKQRTYLETLSREELIEKVLQERRDAQHRQFLLVKAKRRAYLMFQLAQKTIDEMTKLSKFAYFFHERVKKIRVEVGCNRRVIDSCLHEFTEEKYWEEKNAERTTEII